jgi:pimeloyl-ACP methyl ester carboxylesterase
LITDALTLLNHLTTTICIPPSRILLVGQSLGTAVATAVAEHFALSGQEPFAGLILVSGFSSIPRLLETYSIKGIAPPMLSPLKAYPFLQNYFRKRIADSWDTASRIKNIITLALETSHPGGTDISILHARDDWEIPWREGRAIFDAAASGGEGHNVFGHIGKNQTSEFVEMEAGKVRVSWEKVMYGGHNRVVASQVLASEALRAFERNNKS